MPFKQAFRTRSVRPLNVCPWGDSIAYGSSAEPRLSLRWSTLVSNQIIKSFGRLAIEWNVSIAGANVVDVLNPALDTDVLVSNPELIILAGGLNDMRKGTSVSVFEASYNAMVAEAVAFPSVRLVLCCSLVHIIDYGGYAPYDQGSDTANHIYNSSIAAIAAAHGAAFADVHTGMAHNNDLVAADGIHPNTAGHANIANTVIETVMQHLRA